MKIYEIETAADRGNVAIPEIRVITSGINVTHLGLTLTQTLTLTLHLITFASMRPTSEMNATTFRFLLKHQNMSNAHARIRRTIVVSHLLYHDCVASRLLHRDCCITIVVAHA